MTSVGLESDVVVPIYRQSFPGIGVCLRRFRYNRRNPSLTTPGVRLTGCRPDNRFPHCPVPAVRAGIPGFRETKRDLHRGAAAVSRSGRLAKASDGTTRRPQRTVLRRKQVVHQRRAGDGAGNDEVNSWHGTSRANAILARQPERPGYGGCAATIARMLRQSVRQR